MLNSTKTTPAHGSWCRCWSSPAQGLLAALALPIACWFAATAPDAGPRTVEWPILMVDANTAPVPVLEALPGLGPALAGRIAEARSGQPFRSMADVDRRVKGIGPVKAAGLRPFLRFGNPSPASP